MKKDGKKDGDLKMKITKEQLTKIIKEELEAVMDEARYDITGGTYMRDEDGRLLKKGVGSGYYAVDEPEEKFSVPKSDRTEEQIMHPQEWKQYLKLRNQGMQHNETIHAIGIKKLKGTIWHQFQRQYQKGQYSERGGSYDK